MKKFLKRLLGALGLLVIAATIFLNWPFYQRAVPAPSNEHPVDVVMIGAGTMSATLATYLQELEPNLKLEVFERLSGTALESSNGWNNAGTGHTGFAELNYTPARADGSVDLSRAISIAEQFEVSRQFWAHQVGRGHLGAPETFIKRSDHMSFLWGDDNIQFLHNRYEALIKNPLFYGMQYSEDHNQIKKWAPLMIEGRDPSQKIAATYMPLGTDVNYGELTQQLFASLEKTPNFKLNLNSEVTALRRNDDGKSWNVTVANLADGGKETTINTRFVFIGAGGAALKLLQESGIPESKNYAGFPVGGEFLVIDNPALAAQHGVKAYGIAESGSPPMSVPHLDARKLDGKDTIMFGPFALANTKFLKNGSWWDLFSTVDQNNVLPMLRVGIHNLDLVKYLLGQAFLSDDEYQAELQKYFPNAKREDWRLVVGGQRVQIIKRDPEKGAVLQFGTELVASQDGTITALMGASPGASTAPIIMVNLLKKTFPEHMESAEWKEKLERIVPSLGRNLNDSPAYTNEIRRVTSAALHLPFLHVPENLGQAAGEPADAAAVVLEIPRASDDDAQANRQHLNHEMQAL